MNNSIQVSKSSLTLRTFRTKLGYMFLISLLLTFFSCTKELEKTNFETENKPVASEKTVKASASKSLPFYVGELMPVSITGTEARIQFTGTTNCKAYIEYGTDSKYGELTKGEDSFKYSTHRQYIRNLDPGTTYFYRITVENEEGELATASASFTTDGVDAGAAGPTTFTVNELELIETEDTKVRIQFTASAKAQAFIEYGTDTDYGKRTDGEDSFTYAQHKQFINDLSPGKKYFYRVTVKNKNGETASASSTFSTPGDSDDEDDEDDEDEVDEEGIDPSGISASFGEIQSEGLSNACYKDDEHYVAEFLYQNPEVYFWEVQGGKVVGMNSPEPSADAIQLPRPSGGDDTSTIESVINGNAGKDFIGQGTYKIDDLSINVPADIFDMPMVPANGGTKRIINVNSKDVRIFNSPVDGQNSNSLKVAYEVQDGAHNFTLVKSGLKNVFHNNGDSMSAVILRSANDFHIAGNSFSNLLNDFNGNYTSKKKKDGTFEKITARAGAIWMNGGNTGFTSGGYIVNNYSEEFQSNGERKDSEFFVTQSYAGTDEASPVRIYANRTVNAGKRLAKFQEGNGLVLSNYYEWNVKKGRLGDRALLAHVAVHFEDNVAIRNNRVKVGRDTESRFDYLFTINAKSKDNRKQDNIHYDCNDILIESDLSPSQTIRPTLITARNNERDDKSTGNEATNSSANNNVLRGPGTIANIYWFGEGYNDKGSGFQHIGNVYESRMHTRGEYKKD